MRKYFYALFLLSTLLIVPNLFAQSDDVRNIQFDTLVGGYKPTPIGVDQMTYIGTQYITHDDSSLMRYITMVVQFDIDFYADFELVPIDSFYLATYEIKELDLLGWQRLGADLVVKLEAEFNGDYIRARWRLYDTKSRAEIGKDVLERPKSAWRKLGHEISNAIVKKLTGAEGIFLTKIAFIKQLGDAKELFMSDYDGANEIQLTKTGTINLSPDFSPNKPEIYFTSYLAGEPQIFRINTNTKKVEQVTHYKGMAAASAVSPDGNKIACTMTKDGNSEIYVTDLNGKVIKRITHNPSIDTSPTWSPDGKMIAFASDRTGSPQIYITDSDGLETRRLTYRGGYNDSPVWSHRGDRITFVSRSPSGRFDLASVDTAGVEYHLLTEVGMNENPHFSPDGKHLIFSSTRLGSSDLYTADASGRHQRRLTRSGNCTNPTWGPYNK